MIKVLDGVRVLEHGTFITGPAASMLLADLGADVVKVELPGTGDPFRAFKGGLYSPHFQTYNRNKRSIALDTARSDDLAVLHELIATADVVCENFTPRVMDSFGLDYDARLASYEPLAFSGNAVASLIGSSAKLDFTSTTPGRSSNWSITNRDRADRRRTSRSAPDSLRISMLTTGSAPRGPARRGGPA